MNKTNKLLLQLSLIPGVGSATILKLLGSNDGTMPDSSSELDSLYEYSAHYISTRYQLLPTIAKKLVDGLRNYELLEKELELIERYDITLYTLYDSCYPSLLRTIHIPPPVLYVKGTLLSEPSKRLALVGSRKADAYAERSISLLVPALIHSGWQIVSGGALGADSMAHSATVKAGGITHVVLGSGLLHPYPAQNKELFRTIVQSGGSLISSFSLNTPPARGNFPVRNRIISGLSQGCVVVQAGKKSGALITGQCALEQGRHVFAIPGLIDNDLSVGCHALIQQGAKLVCSAQDIVEEFGQDLTEQLPLFLAAKSEIKTPESSKISVMQTTNDNVPKDDTPEQRILTVLVRPESIDGIPS